MDGTIRIGTVATFSAETIQLYVDVSRVEGTIAVPRSQIATLERQQGTRNKNTPVGIVGLLAGGAIAWATLGDEESRSCDGGFGVDVGCEVAADVEAVENATGNVVRVLLGMAIGGGRRSSGRVRVTHGKLGNRALDRSGAHRTGHQRIGIRFRPTLRPRPVTLVKVQMGLG